MLCTVDIETRNMLPRIWSTLLAGLGVCTLGHVAIGHERWVRHELRSQFDRSLFETPGWTNLGALAATVLLIALLWARSRSQASPSAPGRLGSLRPLAALILRISLGVTLLVFALRGQFLAPDLVGDGSTEARVFLGAAGALGALIVIGLRTRTLGWAALGLILWAVARRPFLPFDALEIRAVDVLNYAEVIGMALYLACIGAGALSLDRALRSEPTLSHERRSAGVTALRVFLGATLLVLGLEKFRNPALPMGVLQNYADQIYEPIRALTGITPEGYVFAAALVECTVGTLLVLGLNTRLLAVVLLVLFSTTAFVFHEDLVGHLPLFGVAICLLIEGPGGFRVSGAWRDRVRSLRASERCLSES